MDESRNQAASRIPVHILLRDLFFVSSVLHYDPSACILLSLFVGTVFHVHPSFKSNPSSNSPALLEMVLQGVIRLEMILLQVIFVCVILLLIMLLHLILLLCVIRL